MDVSKMSMSKTFNSCSAQDMEELTEATKVSRIMHDTLTAQQKMANRVLRLAYEQKRAEKITKIAIEKTGKLLEAR
jgi:hypothetical protein